MSGDPESWPTGKVGRRRWPPRPADQPIFYPVLNEVDASTRLLDRAPG